MTDFNHPYADQAHVEIRSSVIKHADGTEATQYHWTVVHNNGQIIATAGENYINRTHALDMVAKLWPGMPVND